ncbi:hypothetical protein INE90_01666 [Bacteroides uniformis]|jgi:hypothetical protein|nr:hypothetical protein INE90_01666 [Bacteroides uniformis]
MMWECLTNSDRKKDFPSRETTVLMKRNNRLCPIGSHKVLIFNTEKPFTELSPERLFHIV